MVTVNNRISVGGSLGTVRFVGKVHVWPDSTALGIEWDDHTRGKNDGSVDSIRYFECSKGSGSFLKESNNLIERSRLVLEALEHRYASPENVTSLDEQLTIGTKKVERYGFSKLNDIVNDYQNLTVLMLDRQCILSIGELKLFPNLEHLDLSYNLFTLWSNVDMILRHTPKLRSLNLNGNRFSEGSWTFLPSALTHISLCDVRVKPINLPRLDSGNILKLDLAGNGWTEDELNGWKVPLTIQSLDLLGGNFVSIPSILQATEIEELTICDNRIKKLDRSIVFSKLRRLDIRHNLFESLSLLDVISVVCPKLTLLRLSHCPAVAGLLAEEMTMELIGRLNCSSSAAKTGIFKLNGSVLLPEEVTNGEVYIVSKIRKKIVEVNNPYRMLFLQEKYRIEDVEDLPEDDDKTVLVGIYCHECKGIEGEGREELVLLRRLMQSNSVLRLKGFVSKVIGKSVLNFDMFYYLHNDKSSLKRYLDDDIAIILSMSFIQKQKIYVEESCPAKGLRID